MMSQFHSQKNYCEMNNIYQLATRWIITLALPVVLLFLLFPQKVMLLFGGEYLSSASVLMVLSVAALIQAVFGTAGSTLTMTGYSKVNLINALIAAVLNIILNIILIPKFCIIGAAIATLISLSLIGVIRYIENWWLNKLQPFNFKVLKSIIAGLVTFGILFYTKQHIMEYHTILTLFFAGITTFGVYFCLLWLFKFDQDDKDVLGALKIIGKSLVKRS